MCERMIERDVIRRERERGKETVYVSGKDIPSRPKWNKHINNSPEEGHTHIIIIKTYFFTITNDDD